MNDQGVEPGQSPSRFSRRVEPFWLNPATIKGSVAIAAGLFLLSVPDVTTAIIRLAIGGGLVVSGASDLWFKGRRGGEGRLRGVLESVLAMVAGGVFLFWPGPTIRVMLAIGAIFLLARGVAVLGTAVRQRRRGAEWIVDVTRGVFLIALGAITLLIPDSVVIGLLAGTAVLAIILGAIMLTYGLGARSDDDLIDVDAATVSQLILDWLHTRDIGDARREAIGDGLFFEEPERGAKVSAWWVMLLLSVAIATFGVMQDSTAVVIGAMLIAPLMTPILGAAAAIVGASYPRMVASFAQVAVGVAAAIGLSFIIGQWIPAIVPLDVNSQVVSRTSPNLIDMLIALAAGAAGAYANVDRRVSDSIAGVAIAVALVPPLGVVGLTLQAAMFGDALGAFLLFLTNLVSIVLAATLVFFLTGYAPFARLRENRRQVAAVLRTVAFAALVILVPLVFTAEGVFSTAGRSNQAQTAVEDWLGEDATLEAQRITIDGADVDVFLTGPGQVPPLSELEATLSDAFGTPVSLRVEYAPTEIITYSRQGGQQQVASGG